MQPCPFTFPICVARIACSYLILMYATRTFQAGDKKQYIGLSLRIMYLGKIRKNSVEFYDLYNRTTLSSCVINTDIVR